MITTNRPEKPILRVMVLIWADMLTTYVMWTMQTYLTGVWNLGFTHAAGIMNVANGLPKVLPLVFYYFVDAGLGNYWMLLLSSFSYAIGLGLLFMSTPPVLAEVTGTCKDYEPQCIGHIQKALLYSALALIAVGISGHIVSLVTFFVDQLPKTPETKPVETKDDHLSQFQRRQLNIENMAKRAGGTTLDMSKYQLLPPPPVQINQNTRKPDDSEVDLSSLQFLPVDAILALVTKKKVKLCCACLLVLFPAVGIIVLPYIKPWSLRFGIPAICSLVATLAFLQGSCKYEKKKSKGSPVTNVFRVLLASTLNMFKPLPGSSNLYEKTKNDAQKLPHTLGLSLLDKAAIEEGPENKRSWQVCTVTEVEETKIVIRMVPIWITLIICGVVTSIGTTFFIEQASHMNYKIGKFKLPNSVLLFLYQIGRSQSKTMYTGIAKQLGAGQKQYAPSIGIALATITSALCCIVAAIVEARRLIVIRDHGLIDKPDEDVPMTVFWIFPQYFLLAVLDSFYENSVSPFLTQQSPPSMQKYLVFLNPGLSGLGMVGSISSVYATGRVSQRNGKKNWFQHNLNGSRLDRYYWALAGLSAVNFIWFLVWACWYPHRDPTSNADEQNGTQTGNQEESGNVERIEETVDIF